MALTDTVIRGCKAKDKPYKLADEKGLFLLVQPSGGKLWRLKYRVLGVEKKLSLGAYPEVSLREVREKRDAARKHIAAGGDPAADKQRARDKLAVSFNDVALEYINKREREGLAAASIAKHHYLLRLLSPSIGKLAISEIGPGTVLVALKRVEAKGNLETARQMQQFAGRVFRHAVATVRISSDPIRDLQGALIAPQPKHYGAVVDPAGVGQLLNAIDGYDGHIVTRLALSLAPHVFVRPGEMRHAEWREIDFDARVWTIPAGKMKSRKTHRVPLSAQSVALLHSVHAITGLEGHYVFPSIRSTRRPMSENTVNAALRRLGYTTDEMTAHGFRAMASTLLNESGKWHPDAIERALAHKDSDNVRAAYARGAFWDERVAMAQWWSDHLDTLRASGGKRSVS
jgi:integrase